MEWQTILLSIAVIVLLIALFNKQMKGGKLIARLKLLKKRPLTFATPHRIELILLSLFYIFFFIADLAQNKFIDLGTDYVVIVFWHITALAVDVWVVFLILFHLALMGLFIMSLKSKSTHRHYDVLVGVMAFFGVAILLAGAIVQIHSNTIHFLFVDMKAIDFYHIGVYLEMTSGLYWTFTK